MKNLIYLSLIFLFLPSLYLPGGNIPVYDIIIGITFFTLLLNSKQLIKKFFLLNSYPIKYLFLYIFWCVFSGLILVILNKFDILNYLYSVFILFIYNDLTWFLLPIFTIPNIISINKIKKFLLVGIYVICFYGLLVFIFNSLNLNILNHIQDIINNRREDILISRNLSVFEEPGYFGGFLCINLPLIYKTVLSKFRISENIALNFFIKKTYIFLVWITIFTIKSPIWLIFCLLSTLIYFSKNIIKIIKKSIISFSTSLIILILGCIIFFNNVNINETFIVRIIKTVQNLNSMESLVIVEPSLANRFISYRARLQLLIENPITGVGYKNTEYVVKKYFYKNNLPLTQETILHITKSSSNKGQIKINGAILWDTISNTGLVGFILLYAFYISSIISLNKIIKNIEYCSERNFMEGIRMTLVSIVLFSFYDIRANFVYFWFLFGLAIAFNEYYRRYIDYWRKQ